MGNTRILMIYPERRTVGVRFFPLGFFIASTILKKNGFDVACLDLSFFEDYQSIIQERINEVQPNLLGFSICGAENYKYALDIIRKMMLHSSYPIIFGGQHMQPPTEESNYLYGSIMGDLEKAGYFYNRRLYCSKLESVDYSLVPFLNQYYPSFEISRGCWNHCQFCNSNNKHIEKSSSAIAHELNRLSQLFPKGTIVTLAGSNHLFKNWRRKGLFDILLEYSQYFFFNFNLGIESGWEYEWETILKLNLWNIFVGVESCDEATLLRMQKSKNPSLYLKKASDFLSRCNSDGVYTLATYIYGYPGNTSDDLDKLDAFFSKYSSKYILQVGFPCEAYPGTKLLLDREKYEKRGVVYNKVYPNENIEYYHLDISKKLKYQDLEIRAKHIAKIVNSSVDKHSIGRCKGKSIID